MSMRKRIYLLLAVVALAMTAAGCGSGGGTAPSDAGGRPDRGVKALSWAKMPEMSIDLNHEYKAVFETTKGTFTVALFADKAPVTVNNFVFLAREGFYEGLTFHTVIESFMIQSGDPLGNGTGSPGYRIPDELDTSLTFEEGVVAMFNTGAPNTGGSQFFICTGPDAANLNREPNYAIFGKVERGMDVVKAIASVPVKNNKPIEDVVIESVVIQET